LNPSLTSFAAVALVMSIFSCAGTRPTNLGVKNSRLSPCPSSPNCVSSDDADSSHAVPAFQLAMPLGEAWRALRATVASLPRTTIITETDDYLTRSAAAHLGFVDDPKLHLRPVESRCQALARLS
jgi:uncharacterized protein (DUF1499 family)